MKSQGCYLSLILQVVWIGVLLMAIIRVVIKKRKIRIIDMTEPLVLKVKAVTQIVNSAISKKAINMCQNVMIGGLMLLVMQLLNL